MSIQIIKICNQKTTIGIFLLNEGFSDSNIYQLIKEKHILVNQEIVAGKNKPIAPGDQISITLNDEINTLKENDTPLNIAYEDEYLLIVDKPYLLDVEPSRYSLTNNLASMVTHYFRINNIHSKVHLVNRLDKYTSGLVIIAKNRYIKNLMCKTKIIKKYHALLDGEVNKHQIIENKIIKDDRSGKRIVSEDTGKYCKTEFELISYQDSHSLVDITLHTGRTHQIRATFASVGRPLVNDPLYNPKKENGEMLLRAYYLRFIHPLTNITIEING